MVAGVQLPHLQARPRGVQGYNERDEMSDKEIETMIQDKGLTAPRVTLERVQEVIAKEEFFRLTGTLTVCVLTLANGFVVTGESACASPENFDQELGNKIARENAKQKIWALEGYLLKQQLADGAMAPQLETVGQTVDYVCGKFNIA